jgi:RNA polymerase-binding transcription factor DksA
MDGTTTNVNEQRLRGQDMDAPDHGRHGHRHGSAGSGDAAGSVGAVGSAPGDLSREQIDELVDLLRERRRGDQAEAERLAESLGIVLSARSDATADDEHDPEGPTLSSEWSRLQALRGETSDDITAVDAALDRVRLGTFGSCTRCGSPIGVDRLRARPTAELCIGCALVVDS